MSNHLPQNEANKPKISTIYFISGLGADSRLFSKLALPGSLSIVHIDWLEPLKRETMEAYCKRLAAAINTDEAFALVGLSFGGIIATELSQIVQPLHTIIISSAGARRELPPYLRLAGRLRLHRFFNAPLFKIPTPFTYWVFGARTREERQLLRQVLKDTSVPFLQWAVQQILTWKRKQKPDAICHIHGSSDKVLPARFTKADEIVEGGGHLMVFSRAEAVSRLLSSKLGAC